MVLESIAYYTILGKTLIFWTGVLAIIFFILTGIFGMYMTKIKLGLKKHKFYGKIAFILALIHGLLALLTSLF